MNLLLDADTLHAAPAEARREAAEDLARRLGPEWSAEAPDLAVDSLILRHAPTALRFVAVPGGRFDMGITEADLEELSEHVDWTSRNAALIEAFTQQARPIRAVEVRPYLVSERLVAASEAVLRRAGPFDFEHLRRDDARRLARALGFRLPSEAELEHLARDGGRCHFTLDVATRNKPRSRFGVRDIFHSEWAEDDWHSTYDGAPATSIPWLSGDPSGVYRGSGPPEEMQSRDELLFMLAGERGRGHKPPLFIGARLALDSP